MAGGIICGLTTMRTTMRTTIGIRMFPAPKIAPIHLFDSRPRVAMPTRQCLYGRDSPRTLRPAVSTWA